MDPVSDPLHIGQEALRAWEAQWPTFQAAPELSIDPVVAARALADLTARLRNNYPFFHPHYAGQMLKPPHDVAMQAYMLAMQINPNNHALDGGPATAAMEKEVVAQLARVFGWGTRAPWIVWDTPTVTVLRSCLLKPEHLPAVPWLHARVERAASENVG